MNRHVVFALIILLAGMASACGKEREVTTTTNTTSSAAVKGDGVFQKSCIACHSTGDISGGQVMLDSSKVHNDFKSKEELLKFVQTNMPRSSPGSLSKKEYDAVVSYLWDQKQ